MKRMHGAIAMMAVALVAGGCGSKDKTSDKPPASSTPTPAQKVVRNASGQVERPKPAEPLSAVMPAFNQAMASGDCQAVLRYVLHRDPSAKPGGPPVGRECTAARQIAAALKGFKANKAAEYGTGGLLEGRIPKSGKFSTGDAFFLIDRDGRFRFAGLVPATPQIGTSPAAKHLKIADDNAVSFVNALRKKNCKSLYGLINTIGTVFQQQQGNQKQICEGFLGSGAVLAPALTADPAAKLNRMGGTMSITFYGISTKKTFATVIMVSQPTSAELKYYKIHPTFTPVAVYDVYRNTD